MKKIYYFLIVIILLSTLVGCSNMEKSIYIKEADKVKMYYGTSSSYARYISDDDTINQFTDCLNNLTFKVSDKQIDTSTMISIVFYNDEMQITAINVDKEGVFQINEDAQCLEVDSGIFNYDEFFYYVIRV